MGKFMDWLRGDKWRVVAWDEYETVYKSDQPNEWRSTHILEFCVNDRNGKRKLVIADTTDRYGCSQHSGIIKSRAKWVHHGKLPDGVTMVAQLPTLRIKNGE